MPHILNRSAPIVVIIFAALLTISCSSNSDSPREKANQAVAKANQQIAEHNKLFNQSRNTYIQVKNKLESTKDPEEQKKQISEAGDQISQASDTLRDARGHLQEARNSLQGVPNLKKLDPAVKKYVQLLSDAMDAQLTAETEELEFYDVLEQDPALEKNREKALDLLSNVDDDYKTAEDSYAKARDFASSHPNVIILPEETTSQETTSS